MKFIGKIKKFLFGGKILPLVIGERRTKLTPMDKAFIYACEKLGLNFNYGHFFGCYDHFEYSPNEYDFFKINIKVQESNLASNHFIIFVGLILDKMKTDPEYWLTFTKFLSVFAFKDSRPITRTIIDTVVKNTRFADSAISGLFLTLHVSPLFSVNYDLFLQLYRDHFRCANKVNEEPTNDYFSILGISYTRDKEIIKRAYRGLVLKYHPDKNGGNDAMFKKINFAYNKILESI